MNAIIMYYIVCYLGLMNRKKYPYTTQIIVGIGQRRHLGRGGGQFALLHFECLGSTHIKTGFRLQRPT